MNRRRHLMGVVKNGKTINNGIIKIMNDEMGLGVDLHYTFDYPITSYIFLQTTIITDVATDSQTLRLNKGEKENVKGSISVGKLLNAHIDDFSPKEDDNYIYNIKLL